MTGAQRPSDRLLDAGLGSFFRPRDAEVAGIGYGELRRLEAEGVVEREARGLYRRTDAELTRFHDVAAVCARVPEAIVCLLTALVVHEIGTQLPREVWIAIPQGNRAPILTRPKARVMRFSGASLRYGVGDTEFEGVAARITSPARTVVDCFRFRGRVGGDVGQEALDDVLGDGRVSRAEIWRAATACRARSLLGPALDARGY